MLLHYSAVSDGTKCIILLLFFISRAKPLNSHKRSAISSHNNNTFTTKPVTTGVILTQKEKNPALMEKYFRHEF